MKGFIVKINLLFLLVTGLSACSTRTDYAPVSDVNIIESLPKNGIYRVGAGETLYSIAWRFGMDYRDLARRNHLRPPYSIHQGQIIYLTKNAPLKAVNTPVAIPLPAPKPQIQPSIKKPVVIAPKPRDIEPNKSISYWEWPARGQVIGSFSAANKGINISGYLGEPVYATAMGKVVYSGHGLRGYGNLIIIKHNSIYLSAYAHNKKLLVKEGDWVKGGQKIAEMGNTGARRTLLHFEIRRNGRPVNPLIYLPHKV